MRLLQNLSKKLVGVVLKKLSQMLPLKLYPLFYGLQDPVELSVKNWQDSINLIIMQNLVINC